MTRGYVYGFRLAGFKGDPLVKIGCTRSVEKRFRDLNDAVQFSLYTPESSLDARLYTFEELCAIAERYLPLEIAFAVATDDMYATENVLHRTLSLSRLGRKELFWWGDAQEAYAKRAVELGREPTREELARVLRMTRRVA